MNKKIINGFEYLEKNYRPSDIQKLLDNSKTKREVYQELDQCEGKGHLPPLLLNY